MKRLTLMSWLRIACGLAIAGLVMMMWSILDPRAQPILIALSVGQAIGTLSLAIYAWVVVNDYRAQRKARRSLPPPSAPTAE